MPTARPNGATPDALRAAWDRAYLRSGGALGLGKGEVVRIVDLFSGCGGMSLGLELAAQALGFRCKSVLAADFVDAALGVYERNFSPERAYCGDLQDSIRFEVTDEDPSAFRTTPTLTHELFENIGDIDVLIGGPPCQGHSDLNNHSRRTDEKNSLYFLMAAYAAALKPKAVIIENVPPVRHDRGGVVKRTKSALERLGYAVRCDVISLSDFGLPQRRRRHVLLAVSPACPPILDALADLETKERSVKWAIGDLARAIDEGDVFNSASKPSPENKRRIDLLIDSDPPIFDLPNSERPPCHRGDHSYVSMYGRLRPDKPAQTITGGFGSPGQGRFIHYSERRTLTPHEAARLQFFPDTFRFEHARMRLRRGQLAQMIGNAVPPKLAYLVGLLALAYPASVNG